MNKPIYWGIWVLVALAINTGAFPIAAFSLFGTSEGKSFFSTDYLIALIIVLCANIIVIQLLLAIRRHQKNFFLIGLMIALVEIISMILFVNSVNAVVCMIIAIVSIVCAMLLLIVIMKERGDSID